MRVCSGCRPSHERHDEPPRHREVLQYYGITVPTEVFDACRPEEEKTIMVRLMKDSMESKRRIHLSDHAILMKLSCHEEHAEHVPPPAATRIMFGNQEIHNLETYANHDVAEDAVLNLTWTPGFSITVDGDEVTVWPEELVRCVLLRTGQSLSLSYDVTLGDGHDKQPLDNLTDATLRKANISAGAHILKFGTPRHGGAFMIYDTASDLFVKHNNEYPFRLHATHDPATATSFFLQPFEDGLALCNETTGTYVTYTDAQLDCHCPDPYYDMRPRKQSSTGGQRGMKVRVQKIEEPGLLPVVKIQSMEHGTGFLHFREGNVNIGCTQSYLATGAVQSTIQLIRPCGSMYDASSAIARCAPAAQSD